MGKPVGVLPVKSDLFLRGAIRVHAPELGRAVALGMEVDLAAIGSVFTAVVKAGSIGQAGFCSSGGGDGIDIEIVISFRTLNERLIVRRPAVPVGRAERSDLAGFAADGGNYVKL